MTIDTLQFKDIFSFRTSFSEISFRHPITLIVGRNNSGKSQLLDFIEKISRDFWSNSLGATLNFTAVLDQEFLDTCQLHASEISHLTGCRGRFSHNKPGQIHLRTTEYQLEIERKSDAAPPLLLHDLTRAKRKIADSVRSLKPPFHGHKFSRIAAERDITEERSSDTMSLSSKGEGATNLLRKILRHQSFREHRSIMQTILDGMNEIYGFDVEFEEIDVLDIDTSSDDTANHVSEIFVREKGSQAFPLHKHGSGLKTILLVLLNLHVYPEFVATPRPLSEMVFMFEELENYLHPALFRRLLRYLINFSLTHNCRLFLTTHSSVSLNVFSQTDNTQILRVTRHDCDSKADIVRTHFGQIEVIRDLGAMPADLLQANGIVWVEGPSDRIYINRLIHLYSDGSLMEGVDYQCAFFGGAVLAKCQFADREDEDTNYANLFNLNSNIAVICDSDRRARSGEGATLKNRVTRIKEEVEKINNSFLWITDMKEIENYIPGAVWSLVFSVPGVPDPKPFDRFPRQSGSEKTFVSTHLNSRSFDKCKFALAASLHLNKENLASRGDLPKQLNLLVTKIKTWQR